MNMNLNRRLFLRGLGGATVAAPFLSSVAERAAKAQSVELETPKRLIVFFSHYGCLTNRWFPSKSHGVLEAADYEATTLKHLAGHSDKLLMPRGIRGMNEWSFEGSHGQTTDPHTQVCGSYFTCYPVTPNDGKFDAMPTGRSLDHVCAEQISSGGSPLFMQVGGVSNSQQQAISYSNAEEMFPGVGAPTAIFNNLSNLFGQDEVSEDTYRVAAGNSVIDVIRDDLDTLKRVNMSESDGRKLSDWIELLHQTSGQVSAQCREDIATQLGLTSASVQSAGGDAFSVNLGEVTDVMLNLAVLSAICDSNRVIFIKFPGFATFTWDGLSHTKDHHGLSHRTGDANMGGPCFNGVLDMVGEIDDWYAKKFAYLVGQLDSFDEGESTVLDNSATVWFQEMSDGNSHNLNNLPIIQAGSCGGYFKTGQAVNLDGEQEDMTVGNSEGACKDVDDDNTFGVLDSLGTPPDVASQPINKYFCNLMNAIGVKADESGFATPGGTEPVTHFGKYDDTSEFTAASLNDDAPNIKDPDEFAELRANS